MCYSFFLENSTTGLFVQIHWMRGSRGLNAENPLKEVMEENCQGQNTSLTLSQDALGPF
jgi:hypothetical protein